MALSARSAVRGGCHEVTGGADFDSKLFYQPANIPQPPVLMKTTTNDVILPKSIPNAIDLVKFPINTHTQNPTTTYIILKINTIKMSLIQNNNNPRPVVITYAT
jgi:hypothetical protein